MHKIWYVISNERRKKMVKTFDILDGKEIAPFKGTAHFQVKVIRRADNT